MGIPQPAGSRITTDRNDNRSFDNPGAKAFGRDRNRLGRPQMTTLKRAMEISELMRWLDLFTTMAHEQPIDRSAGVKITCPLMPSLRQLRE